MTVYSVDIRVDKNDRFDKRTNSFEMSCYNNVLPEELFSESNAN